MALIIVTGGTTGLTDGTAVSESGRTAPLVFSALNTPVSAHVRRTSGYYSADTTFTVPAGLEVSFNGGTTWYGSGAARACPEIEDVNYPVLMRDTTGATSAVGTFSTAGTDSAITALGTVAGFTATAGNATVTLDWTATANASGYIIEWGTTTGYGSTITIASGATATYSHTGRTNSTAYYYRIHAVGTGRYSDGATATASATTAPQSVWDFDESAGTVPDTGHFTRDLAGSNTIATDGSGFLKCHIVSGSATSACALYAPTTTLGTNTRTIKNKLKVASSGLGTDGSFYPFCVNKDGVAPIFYANFMLPSATRRFFVQGYTGSAWRYYKADGSNTYTATINTAGYYYTYTPDTTYVVRLDITTTTLRIRLQSADEATTYYDTGAVAISTLVSTTAPQQVYCFNSDRATNNYGDMLIDSIYDVQS